MTLKEIGKKVLNLKTKELEVERERIRQIVNYEILSRMQHPSMLKYLEPYFATSLPEAEEVFKKLEEIEKSKKQKAGIMKERVAFRNFLLDFISNNLPKTTPILKGLILNRILKTGLTCPQLLRLSERELIAQLGIKTQGKCGKIE